jgi:hypothetical protein
MSAQQSVGVTELASAPRGPIFSADTITERTLANVSLIGTSLIREGSGVSPSGKICCASVNTLDGRANSQTDVAGLAVYEINENRQYQVWGIIPDTVSIENYVPDESQPSGNTGLRGVQV